LQMQHPGMPFPGEVVQSRRASFTGSENTNSATFVNTNTAISLAPTSAANLVSVMASSFLGQTVSNVQTAAILMRGGTPLGFCTDLYCIASGLGAIWDASELKILDAPGTTSLTTWTVAIRTQSPGLAVWKNSQAESGATISATEIMT